LSRAGAIQLNQVRIPDQKRQRLRSKPATISDLIRPQIPTEVHHQDDRLRAGADIGC
jgi:hypothetical protein